MKKPRILFLSRPLAPPWDEANKNRACLLWQNINNFNVDTVGTKGIQSSIKHIRGSLKSKYNVSWSVLLRFKILFDLLCHMRKYDIVHFFLMPRTYSKFFFKYLCRVARVKVVQNIHGEPIRREKIDNILFGDLVIVHSKYRERLLKIAGITNVRYISPGIDLDRLNQQNKLPNFRNIWNIQDEKVILYAGNYRNDGDMDILLKTIKTIIVDKIPVKFILACRVNKKKFLHTYVERNESKNEADLKRKARELNIDKHIIYMRTVESMPAVIAASDICIFPITEIGEKADTPMIILESMAMGKPIVMSALHPYVEVLKYGGGISVSSECIDGFPQALKNLLLDKKLRRTLGAEGERAVREHFDIKKLAQSYEDLYCELLDFDL